MLENSVTVGVDYAAKYQSLYDSIKDAGQFCFMTVAPKPDKTLSYQDVMMFWFREFYELKKCTDKLLLVVELNKKAQLHFHFMIRLFPMKNKYTFMKCFVSKWYHLAIIEPIYGYPPKDGLPYLFKSTEETEAVIGMPAHYTLSDIPSNPFHLDTSDDNSDSNPFHQSDEDSL